MAATGVPGRLYRAAAAAGAGLRPVVPLLLVNAVAVAGQVAYGLTAYKSDQWSAQVTLAAAVVAALAAESISLYVNWHAHDALIGKSTATAARRRAQAYVIAAVVAAINYSHFSEGWRPTPVAVLTAGCSLLSPWLWGLHTRRAQRVQLVLDGKADTAGAVFSAERMRWFPLLTLGARRWSIFHGVTDPAVAWRGYIADREARKARATAARKAAVNRAQPRPPGVWTAPPPVVPDPQVPVRPSPPARTDGPTEDEYLAAAAVWSSKHRAPITTRRQFQAAVAAELGRKPGSSRAETLLSRYLDQHTEGPAPVASAGGAS